ncbi:DMT family transporter [Clostridium ganghwense]|uniref:DMT family transporter n=1 Tax=Clostridium ganghwense TaxID=312089 RepID=A0ABT4CKB0_9CLOT|nr:DMT family transporter [Clostridium ganghwense]MCY6369488.1 DMT family transporter [Clostridium ganghwense]
MHKLSAVFIGLLIAIMVTFNGFLAKYMDDYLSVLIIHIVGFLAVSLILIIRKKKFNLKQGIPIYLFSGGAVGVFLVLFNNICFKHMGVSLTLSLGLLGQSIASVIIDHFGLLGMAKYKFRTEKLIGFFLIFVGIVVMITY